MTRDEKARKDAARLGIKLKFDRKGVSKCGRYKLVKEWNLEDEPIWVAIAVVDNFKIASSWTRKSAVAACLEDAVNEHLNG